MKFIGQYIQDFIARFRSDVYLEDVSTGTIASGANLGLDSNNKVVKNTVGGGGTTDLTSDVTGVLPIANGGTNSNSAENARTALGVDAAGTDNSTNVTLAGTPDYITLSGQEITRNAIDLTQDVTGTLGVTKGGTGLTSISTLLNSNVTSVSGNAGTATALATARDINGVSFDGTGDITVTAAGSTLSDTVTVAKGGTGATTLASNSILTGNGTSAVQAESTLSYDSEILDIGADDNGAATIRRLRHTDDEGGDFYIRSGDATGTNKAGGDLQIFGGRATGNAAGGAVIIQAGETNASSGTTLRGVNVVASFRSDGDTLLQGNLIFEGSVPDAHETTFSITNPTADRTITVPDADVDLTKVRAASTTLDGVVELATTAETTTGTDTTRAVTPDGLKDGYQGSTNVTTLGSITTGVWRGTAIDQAYLSGQSGTNTGDEPDADTTTKGIVELATTAEATAGTDTSRAVTAAGVAAVHATSQTGKHKQVFPMNFVDDLGTTKHFMPFVTNIEQVQSYQEEACMVMPTDGRVVSVTVHYSQMHGSDGNITVGIETSPCGQSYANTWDIEETAVLAATVADDHHVFHFAFDNAKHFESTDKMAISIQQSADMQNASRFFWVTAVVEYDWSTFLAGSNPGQEYTTTP